MLANHDIEGDLAALLISQGWDASAPPISPDFDTPYIIITRTGGSTFDRVVETSHVSIDVYGTKWADAVEDANEVGAYLRDLDTLADSQVYRCDVSPCYNNPDPNRPSLARVTFTVNIDIRMEAI